MWCQYIFCRWRYAFYLPRDPTRPLHWDVMHINSESFSQHVIKLKRLVTRGILSSNVNEVIRSVLNFFYEKISRAPKKHENPHNRTKIKKAAFYVHKKHLRGRKSIICLFAFLCFLCFCLVASLCFLWFFSFLCFLCFLCFLRVWNTFCKKKKSLKLP